MVSTEALPATNIAATIDKPAFDNVNNRVPVNQPTQSDAGQEASTTGNNVPPAEQSSPVSASVDKVIDALSAITSNVDDISRKLEFKVSEETGQVVITVYDRASEEVIRQIPGDQAIAAAEFFAAQDDQAPVLGLLLDNEV